MELGQESQESRKCRLGLLNMSVQTSRMVLCSYKMLRNSFGCLEMSLWHNLNNHLTPLALDSGQKDLDTAKSKKCRYLVYCVL